MGADTSERMGTVRAPSSNSWTGAADYVRTAASQLERFANRMDERSIVDAVSDLQWFARRQPALFIGVAFGVGLIGGRFLKAASERPRYAFPLTETREGRTGDRPF